MKRYFKFLVLAGILFITMLSNVKAQERWQNYLDFGIDNTTLLNEGTGKGSSLTNPFIGFNFISPAIFHHDEPRTFNNFRIALNGGYAAKGGAFARPTYKHRFHYGQVTVKPTVMLFDAFNVFLGTQAAYLGLSSRDGADNVDNEDFLVSDPEPIEVAGEVGVDATLNEKFRIYMRYQQSITPVDGSIRHAGFRIGLNYLLSRPGKSDIETSANQASNNLEGEEKKERQAEKHIKQLKDGLLLVRLSSKRKKIQSLEESDKSEDAQELKEKTRKRHQKIIEAFKTTYDFSNVGFFYDYNTSKVLNKNWGAALLKKDSTLIPEEVSQNNKPFYIADIGESFIEANKQTFKGLVIRGQDLDYLDPPFPNKIAKLGGFFFLGLDRSPKELVKKLNAELKGYYKEASY